MAIFASTTTSGYSDPLKALSIKALEQRQKDLMAQQAAQQPDMASMATIPGGIGHVLGVIGDGMKEARAERALQANRDTLAKTMAGLDLNNPDPAKMATIAALAPDIHTHLLSTWAENRRAQAQNETTQRGQTLTAQGVTEGHNIQKEGQIQQGQLSREQMQTTRDEGAATRLNQRDLATDAQNANANLHQAERDFKGAQAALDRANQTGDQQAKIDAQAALAEAQQKHELARDAANNAFKASQPKSDVGAIASDVEKGIVKPEVGAAAQQKLVQPSPKDAEARAGVESTYARHSQSLDKLIEAQGYLNKGINTGPWAGINTNVAMGTNGMIGDKDQAQRTNDFNAIVNENAIKEMSQTLKGQSTDFEMKKFIEVLNNPSSSPERRQIALNNLIAAAKVDKEAHANALRQIGKDPGAIENTLKSPNTAAAAPAAAGGGDVKAVASEAEAMQLPPNTRFKLPDGRTGTAH